MQACLKVSCSQSRDPGCMRLARQSKTKVKAPRIDAPESYRPAVVSRYAARERKLRNLVGGNRSTLLWEIVLLEQHSRVQESLKEHRHINSLMATQPIATVDEAFSEDTLCEKVEAVRLAKAKVATALAALKEAEAELAKAEALRYEYMRWEHERMWMGTSQHASGACITVPWIWRF